MPRGAGCVSDGTVRGGRTVKLTTSFVGCVFGGHWRSAVFHIATRVWHLSTYSMNDSLIGGREKTVFY